MKKILRQLMIITIVTVTVFSTLTNAQAALDPKMENFIKQNTYLTGQFTDVSSTAWYAKNVATAYELGLVKGTTENAFGVSNNITIAETITLAARVDSIFYTGSAEFVQTGVWYQCYVDYAIDAGIITENAYSNYSANATRAQFATIISKALPSYALEEINWIDDGAIPDVNMTDSYADAVYMLYRAGILTGSDSEGTFNPQSAILRTEVAVIVTHMADESLRKSLTLVGEY